MLNLLNDIISIPKKLSTFENDLYKILYDDLKVKNILTNIKLPEYNIEIDFLLPDYNIGIECNGIRFHTRYMKRFKDYHKRKRDILKNYNYKLYNIFSDHFKDKDKIILLLKKKLNQLEDIEDIKQYNRSIEQLDVDKNRSDILNYLYLNINKKKLFNINYYLLYINNRPSAIIGIDISSKEYIKINRFNYIYNHKYLKYYSKSLDLFFNYFEDNNILQDRKFINITIDNSLFTGNSLKNFGFDIFLETEPTPMLAVLSNDTRKGVPSLKKILKSKSNKLLIWDCGKTVFQKKLQT
jgi:hypothetical protein